MPRCKGGDQLAYPIKAFYSSCDNLLDLIVILNVNLATELFIKIRIISTVSCQMY